MHASMPLAGSRGVPPPSVAPPHTPCPPPHPAPTLPPSPPMAGLLVSALRTGLKSYGLKKTTQLYGVISTGGKSIFAQFDPVRRRVGEVLIACRCACVGR